MLILGQFGWGLSMEHSRGIGHATSNRNEPLSYQIEWFRSALVIIGNTNPTNEVPMFQLVLALWDLSDLRRGLASKGRRSHRSMVGNSVKPCTDDCWRSKNAQNILCWLMFTYHFDVFEHGFTSKHSFEYEHNVAWFPWSIHIHGYTLHLESIGAMGAVRHRNPGVSCGTPTISADDIVVPWLFMAALLAWSWLKWLCWLWVSW